jgi:hypothetical protein
MFAYQPTPDRSGEILGAGQMQAAQTNAQMMGQLGQDIGGALQSIGGMYGAVSEKNAMGDSAFDAISAIGHMYPGMKKISSALEGMDPRTRRLASMSILDNLGSISQLGIAGMNNQTRQNAPFANAGLKNAANIAGGNATYAPPADMAPVEPPLPTGGPAPADVAPAPVASGIPGGQASLDAINADRKRRGLPPIQ